VTGPASTAPITANHAVSSHLMSEMQMTADHLVVIGRGRLIADARAQEIIGARAPGSVRVRSPQPDLLPVLCCMGVLVGLLGTGVAAAAIGEHGPPVTGGDVAGQALAIGGYLAFAGVITVGIGAAMRSVAGTLTATWLLTLLMPVALQVTRVKWLATAGMYLPGGAGATLLHIANASYGRPVAVVILGHLDTRTDSGL
jgi:hypothetical protein